MHGGRSGRLYNINSLPRDVVVIFTVFCRGAIEMTASAAAAICGGHVQQGGAPNGGHFCQDGGCGGHPLARGTWVTSESEAAVDL